MVQSQRGKHSDRYQNFAGQQWLATSVLKSPLKLHVADCHIDLPSIQDVASRRARAFGQLVAGGLDIERSVSLSRFTGTRR